MTNTPEMRRPPQLWEQRLTKVTSIVATGLTASGATSLAPPDVPPATGGNFESAAVTPPPGAFIKPSTPTLVGGLQGINVLWDGLNSAGDLWPYDTSFVEVHMATSGTGFTPGTATLKGRLARPGNLFVGGLTAGTTYHFRLMGADAEGSFTDPSDAASGLTGLTTAGDYGTATIGSGAVSFNARSIGGVTNTVGSTAPSSPLLNDVWLDSSPGTAIIHKIWNGSTWVTNAWGSASIAAGQITALQIAAGAITAGAIAAGAITTDKLTAGTITGFTVSAGTVVGSLISGGTITGGFISGGTVSGGALSGGTVSGALVSGGTVSGGFISGGTVNAAVYTGGSISSSTFTGGTIAGNIAATGTVSGAVISGGTVSGGFITGGTVSGAAIRTASSGARIVMGPGLVSSLSEAEFYNSVGYAGSIVTTLAGGIGLKPAASQTVQLIGTALITGDCEIDGTLNVDTNLIVAGTANITSAFAVETSTAGSASNERAFRINTDGEVFSYGIDDHTTASAANVRVGASAKLLKSTSTQNVKTELIPLDGDLLGVNPDKLSTDAASVNPYDVLDVIPTEFQSLCDSDASARMLGFIAENVAIVFPWAAEWDEAGEPSSVADRPILAALLQVVKDQQHTITDLRTRIEALEA